MELSSTSSPLKTGGMGVSAFHVNTKGFCFLCLQQQQLDRSCDNHKNLKLSKYSYRALSRFLRLDFEKMYNFNGATSGFENVLKKTDLSVSLCPDCYNKALSFTKLYQDLEVIRMKIRLSLGKIVDVMEEAKKDLDRMESCKKRMVTPNPVDILNVAILENLRKQTLEKSKPKVQEGTDVNMKIVLNKPKPASKPFQTDQNNDEWRQDPIESGYFQEREKKKVSKKVVFMISSSSSSNYETEDAPSSSSSSISSGPADSDFQLSPSSLSSSSSSSQSRDSLAAFIVEDDEDSTSTLPPDSEDSPDSLKKKRRRIRSRSDRHSKSGSGRETEAAEDETIQSPPRKKLKRKESPAKTKRKTAILPSSSSASTKVFQCQYCSSFSSSKKRDYTLHVAKEHFANECTTFKQKDLSHDDFKQIVEEALITISRIKKDAVAWSCPKCKHYINNEDSLKGRVFRHLLYSHFPLVCEKVVQLQGDRKLAKPQGESSRKFTKKVEKKSDTNSGTPSSDISFSCDKCGTAFKLKYHLRRHQLKNCGTDSSSASNNGASPTRNITVTIDSSDDSDSGDSVAGLPAPRNASEDGQASTLYPEVMSMPVPVPTTSTSQAGFRKKIKQKRRQKPTSSSADKLKKTSNRTLFQQLVVSDDVLKETATSENRSQPRPRSKSNSDVSAAPTSAPERKFICTACGKEFVLKAHLMRHQNSSGCSVLSSLREKHADFLNDQIQVELERQSCSSHISILPDFDQPPRSDSDDSLILNRILPSPVQPVESKPTVLETFIVENDELLEDEDSFEPKPKPVTSTPTNLENSDSSSTTIPLHCPSPPSSFLLPDNPNPEALTQNILDVNNDNGIVKTECPPTATTTTTTTTTDQVQETEVPKPIWTKLAIPSSSTTTSRVSPNTSTSSAQLPPRDPLTPPSIRTESELSSSSGPNNATVKEPETITLDEEPKPVVEGREP